jgi:hypothetical protein
MEQEIKCRAARTWSGWEGKTTVNGETFRSGIIRQTKKAALHDAERIKEKLENNRDNQTLK